MAGYPVVVCRVSEKKKKEIGTAHLFPGRQTAIKDFNRRIPWSEYRIVGGLSFGFKLGSIEKMGRRPIRQQRLPPFYQEGRSQKLREGG